MGSGGAGGEGLFGGLLQSWGDSTNATLDAANEWLFKPLKTAIFTGGYAGAALMPLIAATTVEIAESAEAKSCAIVTPS